MKSTTCLRMRSSRLSLQRPASIVYQLSVVSTGVIGQTPSMSMHISSRQQRPMAAQSPMVNGSAPGSARGPVRPAQSGGNATPALSVLPLSSVLRSYLMMSVSSSPKLLGVTTTILRSMLSSDNALLNLKNPIMRRVLYETFYKQFCAGENAAQVAKTCQELREQGYGGVILEYALEVLADAEGNEKEDVAAWRHALMESVRGAAPGDFVGLKWSGMGPAAMRRMKNNEEPTALMNEAMNAICQAAKEKDVALLPSAEETWSLDGFNTWTMNMERLYNTNGRSVVYNTYQAYLKQTPASIAKHMEMAEREGFTFGVKLVRGAYLGSDDRSKIHSTITDTHNAYDSITSALIHRHYNDVLKPATGSPGRAMGPISVMLATHNANSVRKAQALRIAQVSRNEELTPLCFAQLLGMADEVSCSLIASGKACEHEEKALKERVVKCTAWGPMGECLNYLLRRAAENKDAASRTHESRDAMRGEIWRRMKATVGLA